MSMTVPWTAKIQALVILAAYFLYFFITLLFRPWRAILGTAMHLLVCLHNFVCTGFSQFTDDEGIFNLEGRHGSARYSCRSQPDLC